mgnify:CR=1 FL=1
MSETPPVDDATLAALATLAVPTVTASLAKLGYDHTYAVGITPMAEPGESRMVGRARTLRFIQLREDLVRAQYDDLEASPHRHALESVQPGEIMVIDARGCLEAAVVGDIFTRRVQARVHDVADRDDRRVVDDLRIEEFDAEDELAARGGVEFQAPEEGGVFSGTVGLLELQQVHSSLSQSRQFFLPFRLLKYLFFNPFYD